MYELLALALATDRTRIATLMLGNAGSNRSYKFLDVPDGHHELSHHGKKPEKLAAIAKINRFQVEQFAAFLSRLQSEQQASGDLLGQCLVMFGSGIGDGDRHNHDDLPVLLAGKGGGTIASGRFLKMQGQPMCSLFLSIFDRMKVKATQFGDTAKRAAL